MNKISVYQWLLLENQSDNIIKSFWEILAVGALNTNIKKASAKVFSDILKKIFFRGNNAAAIILPKYDLSKAFCEKSKEFIEEKNGNISLLESVEHFEFSNNKIVSVKTNKREINDFDYVISAVPYLNLKNILGPDQIILAPVDFHYSTIISIHIWLKKNDLPAGFYGLINSPVHWIFNHQSHITLVISDANELSETTKEDLFELALTQLEKYVKISKNNIASYKIIKEKRATFVPDNDITNKRPEQKTKFNNFFLAGDWVNTGLPSTIESAVKSGKIASQLILQKTSGV